MSNQASASDERILGETKVALAACKDRLSEGVFIASLFWPLNSLFALEQSRPLRTASRVLLLLGLPPLLIVVVCAVEGTLLLDRGGAGLLQHAGFMAFFVIHVLVVLILPQTLSRFHSAIRHVPLSVDLAEAERCDNAGKVTRDLTELDDPRRWRVTRVVALVVGVLFVLYNALNTLKPYEVYGHDVWDSSDHLGGYCAARLYLAFTWGFVLPISLHALFAFSYTITRIYLRWGKLGPAGVVAVNALSPDRAGGLRPISGGIWAATLNAAPLGLFVVALACVHGRTVPLFIGTICWMLLMCTMFFGPLYSLHLGMRRRRDQFLKEVGNAYGSCHSQLRTMMNGEQPSQERVLRRVLNEMDELQRAFRCLRKTPVWPFDFRLLTRFLSMVALQVLLTILGAVLDRM